MSPNTNRAPSAEPIPGVRHRLFEESSVRRRIDVVIPGGVVAEAMQEELKRIRRSARVPGFRRGRVPINRIAHSFGEQAAKAVANRLLRRASRLILQETDLEPIAPPEVRVPQLPRPFARADLKAELRFEVHPEIGTLDLSGIELTPRRTEVTEEHIQDTLDQVRRGAAEPGPLRPSGVRDHDVVVGDLEEIEVSDAQARPPPGAPARKTEDVPIRVGSGDYHPALHEALQGARAGDTVVTTVRFGRHSPDADRAGRTLRAMFTIKDGRSPVLPPADDALARKVGADSLLALRGDIRDRLRERAEQEDQDAMHREMMDAVRERNPVEVPEALIEQEMRRQVRTAEQQLAAEEMSEADRQRVMEQSVRENLPAIRKRAEQSLADALLLDAAAREHAIEAPMDIVDGRIAKLAEDNGKTLPAMRATLQKHGGLAQLEEHERRRAAAAFLLGQVGRKDAEPEGALPDGP